MLSAIRQTARIPFDKSLERVPPGGAHIWDAFWEIEKTRQASWGPLAFTYQEIEAYCRMADDRLRPWEVRILLAMDGARRAALPGLDDGKDKPPAQRILASADNVDAFEAALDRFGTVIDVELDQSGAPV